MNFWVLSGAAFDMEITVLMDSMLQLSLVV